MFPPFLAAFSNPFTMGDGSVLVLPSSIVALIVLVGVIAFFCGMLMKGQIKAACRLLTRISSADEPASAETPHIITNLRNSGTCGVLARAVADSSKCQDLTDIREIVSQAAVREENRTAAAFLSFAVGSCLILGLMGTFLAFGELVHRSGLEGDSFQNGISTVVKNLNLAFVASVVGIFVSIVLLFLSVVCVKPQRLLFLADLENFLVANHIKKTSKHAATESEQSGETHEILAKVASKLATAVTSIETVAKRLDKMALSSPEAMASALDEVRKEIAAGVTRYESLVETSSATKAAVEGISERTAAALEAAVMEHRAQQLEVYEQARKFSTDLLTQISENDTTRLKEYRDGLRATGDRLAVVADSWKADSASLVKSFQEERADYVEQLQKAGEASATRFEESSKKSLGTIAEIATTMERNSANIAAEAVTRLEKAYNEQMKDLVGAAEIAKAQTQAARETLNLLESRIVPLGESLKTLHTATTSTLGSAQAATAQLAQIPVRLDQLLDKNTAGIESLSTEAAKMTGIVGALGKDAQGVFRTAGDRLDHISQQLAQVIELGRQQGLRTHPSAGAKLAGWFRKTFKSMQ